MNPPPIRGADHVVAWFGYWPSFHDATIERFDLRSKGNSEVVITAFEMTSEVDATGHYKLTKHCRVIFEFGRASEIALNTSSGIGTIISHLEWEEVEEQVVLRWNSSCGFDGSIRAEGWQVRVEAFT